MLDALRRDRLHPEMCRAEPFGPSGFRRGADRGARGAQRQDLADAAQLKGCRDGAAGVEEGSAIVVIPEAAEGRLSGIHRETSAIFEIGPGSRGFGASDKRITATRSSSPDIPWRRPG